MRRKAHHAPGQSDLERSKREVLRQPGVKELLDLHSRYAQVLEQASPYVTRGNRIITFSSSDSTSS